MTLGAVRLILKCGRMRICSVRLTTGRIRFFSLSRCIWLRRTSLQQFKDAVTSDPRLNVDVTREIDYYSKQSTRLTTLITVLGGLVAAIMAIGAVFGALNTMYSAVAERGREIATMRALGFGGPSVVFSFVIEALLIAFVGGLLGLPGGAAAEWADYRSDESANFFASGVCV